LDIEAANKPSAADSSRKTILQRREADVKSGMRCWTHRRKVPTANAARQPGRGAVCEARATVCLRLVRPVYERLGGVADDHATRVWGPLSTGGYS
jgi:hypothetical protein